MLNVGVIGLGMMGQTHLDVYAKRADVKVAAVADKDPARLTGKVRAAGNVEGQAQVQLRPRRRFDGRRIESGVFELVEIVDRHVAGRRRRPEASPRPRPHRGARAYRGRRCGGRSLPWRRRHKALRNR